MEDFEPSQIGKLMFQLNTKPDCVHILRSMVEVMAMRAELEALESNRVMLAVDELFANITEHGYGGKPGRVEFEAKLHMNNERQKELHFMFRDYAPAVSMDDMNCNQDNPCKASDVMPGGLGVSLIHSIMDVVQHKALSDGNRWLLIYMCK
jgi:anti-sigma regulatory factor (Ser/Thr protein kinase)